MLRIVVTGSECTGKTTLARRLAQFLHLDWVPEYAREYAERLPRPLTSADVDAIANGHISQADRALAASSRGSGERCVVFDTDLVSTVVYAAHYYGACPPWIARTARDRLADLYLLADIDVPWEHDGVRDQQFARQVVHRRFVRQLNAFDATVQIVWGLGEARFQNALAAVRGWRAARLAQLREGSLTAPVDQAEMERTLSAPRYR